MKMDLLRKTITAKTLAYRQAYINGAFNALFAMKNFENRDNFLTLILIDSKIERNILLYREWLVSVLDGERKTYAQLSAQFDLSETQVKRIILSINKLIGLKH